MGQLIPFETRAVARLRERLGAAQEENEDLIAFARGHWGAVASIHAAVLAVLEAQSLRGLLETATRRWPEILGIDCVALALIAGNRGLRADALGIETVETAFVRRLMRDCAPVRVRSVDSGHLLFGRPMSGHIRAEAVIRVGLEGSPPCGLILLGQKSPLELDSPHGSELLLFLGQTVAAAVARATPGSKRRTAPSS